MTSPASRPSSPALPSASPSRVSEVILGGKGHTCRVAQWDAWKAPLQPFYVDDGRISPRAVTPDGGWVAVRPQGMDRYLEYHAPDGSVRELTHVVDTGMIVASAADDKRIVLAFTNDPGNHELFENWQLVSWDRTTWQQDVLDESIEGGQRQATYPKIEIVGDDIYWTGTSDQTPGHTDLLVHHPNGTTDTLLRGIHSVLMRDGDRLVGSVPEDVPGSGRAKAMWGWDTATHTAISMPPAWESLLPLHASTAGHGFGFAVHLPDVGGRAYAQLLVASDTEKARVLFNSQEDYSTMDNPTVSGPWVAVEDSTGLVLIDTRTMSYAYLDMYFGGFQNGYLNLMERTWKDRYLIPASALPALKPCE